ncbi:alkane 1-monooxygenase [Roseovarius pelagicus]|uniref:Alkane 1-monooxygenase n=1 Tax=Roseovarius pelagicus TaxID=2980108 RepID=A0ABY6D6R3_9RHOB|nr:alkane 1-monooxygenase [Roseovarius pelagicus]UXX81836.1 alkane 1-monooxygenase [Roseovarius pelagicus]
MLLFAIATLMPAVLIALGVIHGGAVAALGLIYMTVLVAFLDRLMARETVNADPEAEFPGSTALLASLGAVHFVLLGLSVWAVAGHSGLGIMERVLIGLAAALVFGQISHPAAHELIHKPARALRLMGRLMYTSLLIGHHASAHLRVHHVHVGSDGDPNSAPLGMGFYRFALRAGPRSFRAGLTAETAMLTRADRPMWRHPYLLYIGGAVAVLLLTGTGLGLPGVLAYLAISLYAQLQIYLSDYVQHYGLRRKRRDNGSLEPVGPQHSWNAPHWFSSAVTLNAPRHSDHHVTPSRPYPGLQLNPDRMPFLPRPLPVMAAIALVPPLWRRIMDKRAARWG